ncbi:MAG: rhodanese-like domain-containing protein [Patescibacteria group bacterium]
MKEISSKELSEILASAPASVAVVDVREPNEFAEVRIMGSKNLPLSTLAADSPEIDWSKGVVFVCRS